MLCGSYPIQEGAAPSHTCMAGDRGESQALKQPKPSEVRGLEEHCFVMAPWLPLDSIFLVNKGGKKIWFGAGGRKSYFSIKVKYSQFLLPRPMGKK